jgi:phosphate transport system substrate-binding protein
MHELAEQRVAEAKAGKGEPVAVCDLAGAGNLLRDAALEFARAKMAVKVVVTRGEAALTPGPSPKGRGEMRGETLEKLFAGGAELLLDDVPLDEAGRGRLGEEGGGEVVLGRRAVGVVVHPQNRVESLTTDDLRQILSGTIDRWPGDERITLYGLAASSPVMRIVDEALGLAGKRAKLTARADSAQVIRTVATQPGALGLIDLTQFPRLETTAKLVAVVPGGMATAPRGHETIDEDMPTQSRSVLPTFWLACIGTAHHQDQFIESTP